MDTGEISITKFERLKNAVLFMRKWQMHYEKHKGRLAWDNMRRWEKEVDDILREEIRQDKSSQQQIF